MKTQDTGKAENPVAKKFLTARKEPRKPAECLICGHKWNPYNDPPLMCANCKSVRWNLGKRVKKGTGKDVIA